jgi:hypothetical protein
VFFSPALGAPEDGHGGKASPMSFVQWGLCPFLWDAFVGEAIHYSNLRNRPVSYPSVGFVYALISPIQFAKLRVALVLT